MSRNNFVGYPSSRHHSRACELPHNEEGCGVFAQTAYLFIPNQPEDFSEQQEDSLNMLSLIEEDCSPKVYQISSSEGGNQPRIFPSSPGQLDACKSTMLPTSMAVPGGQMEAAGAGRAIFKNIRERERFLYNTYFNIF
jgi:hypothetical protein